VVPAVGPAAWQCPDRPPTAPANLRVTGTGISTVSLAWDRSSDRWSFSQLDGRF